MIGVGLRTLIMPTFFQVPLIRLDLLRPFRRVAPMQILWHLRVYFHVLVQSAVVAKKYFKSALQSWQEMLCLSRYLGGKMDIREVVS